MNAQTATHTATHPKHFAVLKNCLFKGCPTEYTPDLPCWKISFKFGRTRQIVVFGHYGDILDLTDGLSELVITPATMLDCQA